MHEKHEYKLIILKKILCFLFPFIIFSYFILDGINLPYVGPNATNFSVYSLIAHNYNKFGYLPTKFGTVISVAKTLPIKPEYFIHHPPLLSIVESFFFKAFGEGFWVGRLTVIIFSFGIVFLTFLVGKRQMKKKYNFIIFLIVSIIPASSVFGKMIGQEPLVLFFVLLTLYLLLRYFESDKKRFLFFASISAVFGTLSDWPMLYFTVFLMPLFLRNKKIKQSLFIVIPVVITTIILFLWIYFIRSGFWDLQNAVGLRSVNGLLNLPLWPILWITTAFLRLFIYYNPIFVVLSGFYLFSLYRRHKQKKLSNTELGIFSLFLFGFFHIIIYTQAFFSHPYLIFYFLPFIAVGTSIIFERMLYKRKYFFLFLILSFSIAFLFIIEDNKKKQVEANLWRYELGLKARHYLQKYELIIVNKSGVIDTDSWWYPFFINWEMVDINNKSIDNYKHYVYSCENICSPNDNELNTLKNKYKFERVNSSGGEAFVFFLQKRQDKSIVLLRENEKKDSSLITNKNNDKNIIINTYRRIRDVLRLYQI